MPRSVALFCLALALTGDPMRQAEAAEDCARALAGLLLPNGTIDVVDGGVGDDSGEATLNPASGSLAGPELVASFGSWELAPASFLVNPGTLTHLFPGRPRLAEWAGHLPVGVPARHAWLQRFQI